MKEYLAIYNHYKGKVTKRSNVSLMDHIDQGIMILNHLDANEATKAAFCLHPLFQTDAALAAEGMDYLGQNTSVYPVLLAMEYRARANACLSEQVAVERGAHTGKPYFYMKALANPGSLPEVKYMLIADKVQNRKDFELYHQAHPRAKELDFYFKHWLNILNVDEPFYQKLISYL